MSDSAVLILMPVFNEANNLGQLISTIRRQTHTNFLLVIQDNQSRDSTLEIAQFHETQDKRIQVFSNKIEVSGGENWLSMILKVQNLEKFDYCCFQAGDDMWGDENYLSNLAECLDRNPILGAANPKFKIVNSKNEVLKVIETNLDSKNAFKRIWRLCRNWDNVHQIYGLYKKEVFKHLLDYKVSKFTNYAGSDWWWTYEFLNKYSSLMCEEAIYYKLLDVPAEQPVSSPNLGRLRSYLNSVVGVYKPIVIHLSRATKVRKNIHLIMLPLFYFPTVATQNLVRMHIQRLRRGLYFKRRPQF